MGNEIISSGSPLLFSTHLKGFVQPRLHEWPLHIWVSPLTLYFLAFLWCPSLAVFAETSLQIPALLQASSLLPLDPPSHGSAALSYPNKLLMRPNHARTRSVLRVVLQTLVALVQQKKKKKNLPLHLSTFYTSRPLSLPFISTALNVGNSTDHEQRWHR